MEVATVTLSIIVALVGMLVMLCIFVGCGVLLVKLVRLVFMRSAAPPRPVPAERSARRYEAAVVAQARRNVAATAPAAPASRRQISVDAGTETLLTWRYRQLLELGVDPVTAAGAALAGTEASAVRNLVEHGCPAPLALRIAAPPGD